MKTKICKVIAQTEAVDVNSKKSESGKMAKSYIRLRELGGEYADEYQCTVFGEMAKTYFTPGQIVAANLRFRTHENNGATYQDVVVNEIIALN